MVYFTLNTCFLSFLFLVMVWLRYVLVFLNFLFLFLSRKYYLSKLMLLDFRCQKISLLCKHNFFIDEKHTQWYWDTILISWKHFMVHEMPLKMYFMKWSERKISQCLLPLSDMWRYDSIQFRQFNPIMLMWTQRLLLKPGPGPWKT